MFTHEFLETFDRRFSDLAGLKGVELVLAARAWLRWLSSDVRTRNVIDALLRDGEQARNELTNVVKEYLPEFVALRNQLSAIGAEFEDAPSPEMPSESSAGDLVGLMLEATTFRQFDREVAALNALDAVILQPYLSVTDPLSSMRETLRWKIRNFVGAMVQLPDGNTRLATEEELKRRGERLSGVQFADVEKRYRREIEALGMAFFSSGARALRLLFEILERRLAIAWDVGPGWFGADPVQLPGSQFGLTYLAEAVLLPVSEDTQEAQVRQAALNVWSTELQKLLRTCNAEIRSKLSERALLVSAIDRFRSRCEIHDVDRLRKVAERKSAKGITQAELKLTAEMALYLFDEGFDTFSEVSRGKGRADLVEHGEVYVEAKQVNDAHANTSLLPKAYAEAMDGVRQFQSTRPKQSVRAVVVALFVLNGPRYLPPSFVAGRNGAPDTHFVVIDIRSASQRGSQRPQADVLLTEEDFAAPGARSASRPKKSRRKTNR